MDATPVATRRCQLDGDAILAHPGFFAPSDGRSELPSVPIGSAVPGGHDREIPATRTPFVLLLFLV
jgi:hypothetical protein